MHRVLMHQAVAPTPSHALQHHTYRTLLSRMHVPSCVSRFCVWQCDMLICFSHFCSDSLHLRQHLLTQVLDLSLRLREHSPRLELFNSQLHESTHQYTDHCCAAHVHGLGDAGSADELRQLLSFQHHSSTVDVVGANHFSAVDHVFNASNHSGRTPRAVLYATPGADCFTELHSILKVCSHIYLLLAFTPTVTPTETTSRAFLLCAD